ncbi:Uncharacterised protein [Vibrio cholerae]|nr:Uncharacterised protein [Vibrio cholerae]CSD01087.1 Uncharacterised protein [Vibrio cholerae]
MVPPTKCGEIPKRLTSTSGNSGMTTSYNGAGNR